MKKIVVIKICVRFLYACSPFLQTNPTVTLILIEVVAAVVVLILVLLWWRWSWWWWLIKLLVCKIMFGGSNHHQHTPFSCEHLTNFIVQKKSLALHNKKSTPYTSLPHDILLTQVRWLLLTMLHLYFIVIKFKRGECKLLKFSREKCLSAK